MSYLVLARKYRPRTFAEVVGQDVVTGILRGAIAEGRIGHAYLFCGPRGTGKTTTARILAKALNCELGPRPDPCGECDRCLAAEAGAEVDLVEIDAASNTGVEDIRELRDQVAYAPMRARFKVYIVDEVHMLSRSAFNALLKTLEEPPPHVKFLFATTEPHRLPDTVLSRCQVMRLEPIDERDIVRRLEEVARLEGILPEEGVLEEIARRSRGGMRDALSLTDQLLSMVGEEPRLEDLRRLEGGGFAELDALLTRVEEGDRAGVLAALPAREGSEGELLAGLLDHLRQCLLVALCGHDAPHVQGGEAVRAVLGERARRLGADRLELWLAQLLHARERVRLLPAHARLVVEMALLELCRGDGDVPLDELVRRLEGLESRVAGARPVASRAPAPSSPPASPSPPASAGPRPSASSGSSATGAPGASPGVEGGAVGAPADPAPRRAAPPEPSGTLVPAAPAAPAEAPENAEAAGQRPRSNQEAWQLLLTQLAAEHGALGEMLGRCGRLVELGEKRAIVQLDGTRQADKRMAASRRNVKACSVALSRVTGRELEVTLEDSGDALPDDSFTETVRDLFDARMEDRR